MLQTITTRCWNRGLSAPEAAWFCLPDHARQFDVQFTNTSSSPRLMGSQNQDGGPACQGVKRRVWACAPPPLGG